MGVMDYKTLDAVKRLLRCIDYQTGDHPDVRVRDLWGAARALAELQTLAEAEESVLAQVAGAKVGEVA